MKNVYFILGLLLTLNTLLFSQGRYNGFDLESLRIPKNEILHGGPPKDGIRSIDRPVFESVLDAEDIKLNDMVLGIFYQGIAKAYPLLILDRHEIVNDSLSITPVVISYCPLCRSGMAFHRKINGRVYSFGVSGLLYNSDVLMYDRETESLWSQIMMTSVAGLLSGMNLELIPMELVSWAEWKDRYPNTLVLSSKTGFGWDYSKPVYGFYESSDDLMFPVSNKSKRFKNKDKVLGINYNGITKAYPFPILKSYGGRMVEDDLNGEKVFVFYDPESDSGVIKKADGQLLPATTMYWFAWFAFHPKTKVFSLK